MVCGFIFLLRVLKRRIGSYGVIHRRYCMGDTLEKPPHFWIGLLNATGLSMLFWIALGFVVI